MVTKKKHAELAEQFNNRMKVKVGWGKKVPSRLLSQRERLYLKMRAMNPKGRSVNAAV